MAFEIVVLAGDAPTTAQGLSTIRSAAPSLKSAKLLTDGITRVRIVVDDAESVAALEAMPNGWDVEEYGPVEEGRTAREIHTRQLRDLTAT